MAITNQGSQEVTFDFQEETKASEFNKLLRDVLKDGIYSGGALTRVDDNTVSIAPFTVWINTGTDKSVKISTSQAVEVTVNSTNPIIYISYEWLDVINNWLDFGIRGTGDSAVTNEIKFGKANYTGPTLVDFDTTPTYRDYGTIDIDNNKLYVDDIKATGDVDIDGNIDVGGTLNVVGATTLGSTLDVTGDSTLHGTLSVTGNITGDLIGDVTGNTDTADGINETGISSDVIHIKKLPIGDWNMDSDQTVLVAHGLTLSKIIGATAIIINDAGDDRKVLNGVAGTVNATATHIALNREDSYNWWDGTGFNSSAYDSTSYNRGFIIIYYID